MLRGVVTAVLCCCLLFESLRAHLPLTLPAPHFDLATAKIWSCNHSSESGLSLQELHRRGHAHQLEILHVSPTSNHTVTVNLLTPVTSTHALHSLGLTHCTQLAHMEALISAELAGSWHTLKHHLQLDAERESSLPITIRDTVWAGRDGAFDDWREGSHRVLRRSTNGDKDDEIDEKEIVEWFSQYHNHSSMYHWYLRLSEDHPDRVHLNKTIGWSYHQREIAALHITEKTGQSNKPKIFLQCLLHSREWISGSVCMYLSYRLANPHPSDTTLLKLLQEVEFVIVPVANPDGYYATWVEYPKYRLWRKNVQPLEGSHCAGVDLNRNFDSHWDQDTFSRSDDPCSELYHGPSAGSELEVQALTSFIQSLGRVIGAIDFHSYHQKILHPPAFSGEGAGDLDRIQLAAQTMAQSASEGGHTYTPHKMFDLYSAAGTFADWLLDYRNNPAHSDSDDLVPLTVELRPHAGNVTTYTGFLLPTIEILPTCHEMYLAFLTFSEFVLEEFKKQS